MPKKQEVDVKNANVVKRGNYAKVLNAIIAGGFCPFCEEHLFKHHQRPLIHKSKYWLATESTWPYKGSRHHFLLISRIHVEKTEDLSLAAGAGLLKMYHFLVERYELAGATLVIRSGDTRVTGASVNHLHAHLIVGARRKKKSKPIKALVGFEK